ncbi:TRAP transporter substrate-binding protein DctP [Alcaligenaceae bacterium]|nr:TRAP transporter substrate-binding protein DctP [Alcaligenaceae bacterium]
MQRRSFLKKAGAGLVASSAIAAPAVHAQTSIRWRLATSFNTSLPAHHTAATKFTELVSSMSGGKFTISLHHAGELMPAFGVLDGVENGTVEGAYTNAYYFVGKNETFGLGTGLPFGLNSRQMTAWMYDGNGLDLMREFYRKYNIISFPMGNTGTQMGGWYRKEINTLDDLKGLKIRIPGLAGMVFERLGAVPQQIPGSDVYTSLEKGTIDAAEWSGPLDDLRMGLNKVAPHYYYPGWWEGCAQVDLFFNTDAYDKLPQEYKSILEAASAVGHIKFQSIYDARNPQALKEIVASGTKLHRFPKPVMDASFAESMALFDEISARNPDWKKIYDDFSTFRANENLWFRFAEGSFDQYMQSQKF